MAEYLDSFGLSVLLQELYAKIIAMQSSIQLDALPVLTADNISVYNGKIYQYTGETDSDNPNSSVRGHFYTPEFSNDAYYWAEVDTNSLVDSTGLKFISSEAGSVYDKITDIEKSVTELTTESGIKDVVDNKNYFRTLGSWVEFTEVDGSTVKVTIKKMDSGETYVPDLGEFVYLPDKDILVFGDGTKTLIELTEIRATPLTYTPENSAMKGAASGYAPLDESSKVPAAYLPTLDAVGYTKEETDELVNNAKSDVTLLVNNEAATRTAGDTSVQTNLDQHIADTALHVTPAERDSWNAKLDQANLDDLNAHVADATIHVTAADKNRWDGKFSARIVNSVEEMNAIDQDSLNLGDIVYIKTGTTETGAIQADRYIWYGTDNGGWNRDTIGSILSVEWSGIKNGPNSTVIQIEYAARSAHEHANKAQLDQISETERGALTYRGEQIGATILYFDNDGMLPTTGRTDTIYVVYDDSSAYNQPTIRTYKDGKYIVLGRIFQNQPSQITNTRILQDNVTVTTANTKYNIVLPKDTEYKFIEPTVLKQGPTTGAQTVNMLDRNHYEYDSHLFQLKNGNIYVGTKLWDAVQYDVSDAIYFKVSTNTAELKNIINVI